MEVLEHQDNLNQRLKTGQRLVCHFGDDETSFNQLKDLLSRINDKKVGKKVTFSDLVLHLLSKVTDKDIESLRAKSLSAREKIEMACVLFNERNSTNLTIDEYICHQLKIH